MIKERDILYEKDGHYVAKVGRGKDRRYEVMRNKGSHSVVDSAYELTKDGLSIAKARCNHLAGLRGKDVLKGVMD